MSVHALPVRRLSDSTLRLRRICEHVCDLHPRALYEAIVQAQRDGCTVPELIDLLDDLRCLSPAILAAAGGDRFPPALRVVPR